MDVNCSVRSSRLLSQGQRQTFMERQRLCGWVLIDSQFNNLQFSPRIADSLHNTTRCIIHVMSSHAFHIEK